MLAEVIKAPALPQIQHLTKQQGTRVGDLFRDLINAHVNAELALCKKLTNARAVKAVECCFLLWCAPSLLLRNAHSFEDSERQLPANAKKGIPSLRNVIAERLRIAEAGEWDLLLHEYLRERALLQAQNAYQEQDCVTRDAPEQEDIFRRAVGLMDLVFRKKRPGKRPRRWRR